MSQPETPNPEQRSNNAILCFCIGAGLAFASYLFGFGGAIAAAFSGGNPALLAGGIGAMIAVVLAGVTGFILMGVGAVWMIVRVIADQAGDKDERRFRDIQR